ncbi:MAG TPA: DNA/RNA non-specific endonuclease [Oligoflexus sp.]|nr:DNA/RNA non-specific endonuclease [Oligoflexus sp.]HYX39391.1 DNA/RNA non-specific endonuclease [Oligoflexus sp.]
MVLKLSMMAMAWLLTGSILAANVVTLKKEAFTLTYDCDQRSALRYDYTLNKDTGSASRPNSYYPDPDLPVGCEGQFSGRAYASVVAGWDRGHLVTSNHMDRSANSMKQANYMSNIAPQASGFNQGIWVDAENVAECYRDVAPVRVVGGLVYDDPSNDFFLESHGIATPEYFWKVILTSEPKTGAQKAIAWLIPNTDDVGELDEYILSIEELEDRVGVSQVDISVSAAVKAMKPTRTWSLPGNCNPS